MYLNHILLQNFRSYSKSDFSFSPSITVIVGPNTSGKTNLLEAISCLSTGDSFRTEKDIDCIKFGETVARIIGETKDTKLEFVVSETQKKYLVNGVAKRRSDFAGNLTSVVFAPSDLDIIVGAPGLRRRLLDEALYQTDRNYRVASIFYAKALRQRNALLTQIREHGVVHSRLEYWDSLVIEHGGYITKKREELITYFNTAEKDVFNFSIFYDSSIISKERLLQYKDAEIGAGVTLVGPHRDDFSIHLYNPTTSSGQATTHNVKLFGSRGQQRLVVLQLKLLQLDFMEQLLEKRPVLLLDDIFSELDDAHIHLVSEMIGKQQTILTTTHKEFIDPTSPRLRGASVIELAI